MKLKIETKRGEGRVSFHLKGNLNTSTYLQFQELLIPAFDEASGIDIDFADLEFFSTDGFKPLLAGIKKSKETGVPMTLSNVSKDIMEVFRVTGFAKELTIV